MTNSDTTPDTHTHTTHTTTHQTNTTNTTHHNSSSRTEQHTTSRSNTRAADLYPEFSNVTSNPNPNQLIYLRRSHDVNVPPSQPYQLPPQLLSTVLHPASTTPNTTTRLDPPNLHPAAMSALQDTTKNVTGAVQDTTKKVGGKASDTQKVPQKSKRNAPRSIPDDSADDEPTNEGEEGEMVPAAGRINEKGEVIDDDGNAIGRVTDGNAKDFVGYIVTQEGDVLDGQGGVVGKAEPLEDVASDIGNYTTQSRAATQELAKQQGGGVGSALGGVGKAIGGVTGGLGKTAKGATGAVGDTTKGLTDTVGNATGTQGITGQVGNTAKGATDAAGGAAEGVTGQAGEAVGNATGQVGETAEGAIGGQLGLNKLPQVKIPEFSPSVAGRVVAMYEGPFTVANDGWIKDRNEKILGRLADGCDIQDLVGKDIKGIDEQGQLLGDNETVLGKVDLAPEGTIADRIRDEVSRAGDRLDALDEAKKNLPDISILEGLTINKSGNVVDEKGNPLGKVKSGDISKMIGKMPDAEGKVYDGQGNVIGEVEVLPEAVQNIAKPFEDFPDAVVDENGKVIFEGRQVGVVVGDDWENLVGKKVDADGDIVDKNGNVIGHAERHQAPEALDYACLVDKKVNKLGNVVDDKGMVWGNVVQGILAQLVGKKVGEEGQIFNDGGKVIGKAEPLPAEQREDAKPPGPFEDFPDALVGDNGAVMYNGERIGTVVEGDAKALKGKPVDADGDILDKNGNLLGRAERWEEEEAAPVDRSILAGKRVNKVGNVCDKHGEVYGRVIEGELTRLVGKMCDKEGFIRNEGGDVIGKADIIPEAEREGLKEGPFSELPGCTVNKDGHIVTPGGDIVGRLTSGDPQVLFGRAVDDDGEILDKNGNTLGTAERWQPEEVQKEVSPMSGRKVNKEGNVVDENGDVIGKLTHGELSVCTGKAINDEGAVVDGSGNIVGQCTLLQDIPEPKDVNPMAGRKVNKEGNVTDESGNIIGKLTSGALNLCAGKEIDNDGDVVDSKGSILGHVTLISDIPEEEPEGETEEQRLAREQLEKDREIAKRICVCIEQSLDKIRPICKMIVDNIDRVERQPENERDEEDLVKTVKPLIEEGGKILTEANGVIRGLDPDGRIAGNAQGRSAAHEATPEEYHLADLLKELTGTVTETIEHAKRKLEDMQYAKKELNPLWGLLAEPLFQIIAAVGLLLSGVLGLVGKLLNGLGLGGLVNNLLGGLGLNKVLDGLGLGGIVGAVTGQDKKKGGGKKS